MHSRTDVVQNRDWQRGAVSLGEPPGEKGRNCRGTIVVTCKGTNLFEKHKMIVAQGADEFLRLLNEVEEDGHAFKNTEGSPLCTQLFRLGLFDLC